MGGVVVGKEVKTSMRGGDLTPGVSFDRRRLCRGHPPERVRQLGRCTRGLAYSTTCEACDVRVGYAAAGAWTPVRMDVLRP